MPLIGINSETLFYGGIFIIYLKLNDWWIFTETSMGFWGGLILTFLMVRTLGRIFLELLPDN